MNTVDQLQLLIVSVARHIPTLVIGLAGFWFSFARRDELGRARTYAVWGFGSLIAYVLLSVIVQHLLVLERVGGPSFDPGRTFLWGLWNLAAYLIFLGGLAALACAVFVGRSASRDEPDDTPSSGDSVRE